MSGAVLMWFRRDLRLADNEAFAAAASAENLACVAVLGADESAGGPDSASRRWRSASLASLDADLRSRGSALAVVEGEPHVVIPRFASRLRASAVFCTRDHTPVGAAEERRVADALRREGIALNPEPGQLLVPPGEVAAASGGAFRVFTPFFRAWLHALPDARPRPAPLRLPPPPPGFAKDHPPVAPCDHGLEPPTKDVHAWTPGEAAALGRLARFAEGTLPSYEGLRDRPDVDGTSELSPRLAHGELSARQVVSAAFETDGDNGSMPFVRQVAWREFSYHVLAAFPDLASEPWRAEFSAMPWLDDPDGLAAWIDGRTGFPLVDAGMRQLGATGWMHNRVRLVAASFLSKDLLVPWQTGERVFAERLADYDPAVNPFNWQWVAGSGADASPYFRVFNPVLQGGKFDPEGEYVRRWVPELKWLQPRWIHHPWEAPGRELRQARVVLGRDYPAPLVDHAAARHRALAALEEVRASRPPR